jgi:antitoxin component YwqK of YwqJK toxin-antitoxin module
MKNVFFLKLSSCLLLMLGLSYFSFAQYKSFKISAKGDTINIVNAQGFKQGRWVNKIEELRGEPGYEEEGVYNKSGEKNGVWRLYTLEGDLLGMENYLNGGKDGLQQYYSFLGNLLREENWRGFDPEHPYDTIPVYGTGSNEIVEFKVVKAEPYSVKQGVWKYYDSETGRLIKTENWQLNNIVDPEKAKAADVASDKKKEIKKTPEMLEWEKKNRGKKNAIRDGRTGM